MAHTPMMQQYHDAKQAAGDALLLFRMGDFYELFFDDAKAAARILGLSLTSRDKGENPVPMAGFPHHQLESYLARIIAAGFRAAVCEQLEDPRHAKGIVKRDITRIVSRGTVTDDALLEPRTANYLLAVAPDSTSAPTRHGLAWIDVSTGRFEASTVSDAHLGDELARINPVELLLRNDAPELPARLLERRMTTKRPAWAFGRDAAHESLTRRFGTRSLEGFGFDENDDLALAAAGAVIDYLSETQRASLDHVERLVPQRQAHCLQIDEATRRSLEISTTIRDGRREGSLLGVIDRTITSMGARLLDEWLASPLTDPQAIDARLDAVEELLANPLLRGEIRSALGSLYDLPRLVARVATGRATPRDLSFVGRTLERMPRLKSLLGGFQTRRLRDLEGLIDPCSEIREELQAALADDCPLNARDGGFIRSGFHDELDRQRDLAQGGKKWIAKYQAEAVMRTGIASMKVGFNKVFGYYLEATHAHRDKIPPDFIRKQTLKNAERYVTPELKEHEERVLAAEDQTREIEMDLFIQLRDLVAGVSARLQATSQAVAQLDVLAGLAELAAARSYSRPSIVAEPRLDVVRGRHPVLDVTEPEGTFVPNDIRCTGVDLSGAAPSASDPDATTFSGDDPTLLLITGPNMAGKSTYIRQVALIALMAQVGSYVPAERAVVGIADRIFARVGASDDLARGRSTFMVEMTETARILNTATSRSLVILDEIGRGTSTYDGLSLAWAVVEHMHDVIGCRALFATHYHELTDLAVRLPRLANRNVAVQEWNDQVVFLHQIVPGAADKSYGIHVAQLAGVPASVNRRAAEILARLEEEKQGGVSSRVGGAPTALPIHPAMVAEPAATAASRGDGANGVVRSAGRRFDRGRRAARGAGRAQLTLFELGDGCESVERRLAKGLLSIVDELQALDLDSTTPLAALQTMQTWKERLQTAENAAAFS